MYKCKDGVIELYGQRYFVFGHVFSPPQNTVEISRPWKKFSPIKCKMTRYLVGTQLPSYQPTDPHIECRCRNIPLTLYNDFNSRSEPWYPSKRSLGCDKFAYVVSSRHNKVVQFRLGIRYTENFYPLVENFQHSG